MKDAMALFLLGIIGVAMADLVGMVVFPAVFLATIGVSTAAIGYLAIVLKDWYVPG